MDTEHKPVVCASCGCELTIDVGEYQDAEGNNLCLPCYEVGGWDCHFRENARCLIEDSVGIYIPQRFAKNFDMDVWHVEDADARILLAGPDHVLYWDTWDSVLSNAYCTQDLKIWRLYQDSDLFAVPDME